MSRPLFKIAMEIASDWHVPSPQAKAYLKGMYYLLGMDDRSADLDAHTTVRFFLLYAKEWHGPVSERIKKELQDMRSRRSPTRHGPRRRRHTRHDQTRYGQTGRDRSGRRDARHNGMRRASTPGGSTAQGVERGRRPSTRR